MPTSAARPLAARTPTERLLALANPPEPWPRWTRFRYHLSPRTSRRRVAVWRALRSAGGVNLEQGEWAVPHRDVHVDLRGADRLVEDAGGAWTCEAVGTESADHLAAHLRLRRRCDRLWDDYFIALDSLTVQLGAGAVEPATLHRDIQQLREQYAATLATDIVGSDASVRAAARVRELATLLGELAHSPGTGVDSTRVSVEVGGGWQLVDGRARWILRLCPTPSVFWERAFDAFEATTFSSSGSYRAIRNSAVTVVCRAEEIGSDADALRSRIGLFHRSLAR